MTFSFRLRICTHKMTFSTQNLTIFQGHFAFCPALVAPIRPYHCLLVRKYIKDHKDLTWFIWSDTNLLVPFQTNCQVFSDNINPLGDASVRKECASVVRWHQERHRRCRLWCQGSIEEVSTSSRKKVDKRTAVLFKKIDYILK